MRHLKTKLTLVVLISIVFILILQVSVLATNEKLVIVKNAEEKYIIYIDGVEKEKFEFAFSSDKETEKTSLDYINSIQTTDLTETAYLDSEVLAKIKDKNNIYIWVKIGENYVLEAQKVDLNEAIEDSKIKMVENITKIIRVNTEETETREEVINNVKTTITTGKVDILEDALNTYYYQLIRLPNTEDYNRLMSLAEEIYKLNSDISTFEKLAKSKEFYNLYNELIPNTNDENWLKVNNMKVKQPEDSKQDEKYIVWLKMVTPSGEEIIDAQFLKCYEDYKPEYIKEDVVVKTTNKLPITYDSIALIVLFAILILAIIVIYAKKKKAEKNGKEN